MVFLEGVSETSGEKKGKEADKWMNDQPQYGHADDVPNHNNPDQQKQAHPLQLHHVEFILRRQKPHQDL